MSRRTYTIIGFFIPLIFVLWIMVCSLIAGSQMEPRSLIGGALFMSPFTGFLGYWFGGLPEA